ncbi:PREDICTED: mitogen-activated protein kinase kinase kinase ANP1-like [Prunus mume]|uniref:Mitogen-activated protein kinase kinase kinase ANP1-like n=1 Tax=Prunus mume TaxID=102107 RepID=A0ABM1LL57_PRUMU|nr:PREDICTED: mitogen-activated protein kinase kinase kinase ANP1-like [Prunus mume]
MDWTRGPTIGHGSSATVSIAKSHGSGEVFAVKSAKLSQSHSLQMEQTILSTLSSAQIVSYKGCNTSTENGTVFYNLFLEYAPGGTLSDAIRSQGGRLNEAAIRSYTRQILLGLHHLHSNQIAHCDIKGQNVLVTNNGADVKLADLGCAKRVNFDHGLPIGGTPVYMAPEVARGEQQGLAADVWALGCTVIEMATGRATWPCVSDPVSAMYKIGFSGEVPEIPSSLSKKGRDFVTKCLMRDPMERWSAGELLKHGFLLEAPNYLPSPTTVLDHGLWEEEFDLDLEHIWEPTHQSGCSNSARERIRLLSEGKAASFLGVTNWPCDDEDTWVTVRSNNIEHPDTTLHWNEYEANDIYDDKPQPTKTNAKPTSGGGLGLDTSEAASFSSRQRKKSRAWMTSKCNQYVFCGNLNFVNKELRLFIDQLLIIIYCFPSLILSHSLGMAHHTFIS